LKTILFDAVIATDVLAHLDNLHDVFNEIVRIGRGYIIISLSNPVKNSISYWKGKVYKNNLKKRRKHYGKYMKFYGLLMKKLLCLIKRFFNYEEILEFMYYQCRKYFLKIVEYSL